MHSIHAQTVLGRVFVHCLLRDLLYHPLRVDDKIQGICVVRAATKHLVVILDF